MSVHLVDAFRTNRYLPRDSSQILEIRSGKRSRETKTVWNSLNEGKIDYMKMLTRILDSSFPIQQKQVKVTPARK